MVVVKVCLFYDKPAVLQVIQIDAKLDFQGSFLVKDFDRIFISVATHCFSGNGMSSEFIDDCSIDHLLFEVVGDSVPE